MKVGRRPSERNLLIYVSVTVAGIALIAFGAAFNQPSMLSGLKAGSEPQHFALGSSGLSDMGWLIPADKAISTSYTSNSTASGFVEGIINIFPFELQANTTVVMGLYTNGKLLSTRSYDLSEYSLPSAEMLSSVSPNEATFSSTFFSLSVSELNLASSLPTGTVYTVVMISSSPLWVQIDDSAPTQSFFLSTGTSVGVASVLSPQTGVAPNTVSVGIESNA